MKDHARIRVELVVTNLLLDLIAENIDVAIRVGELQDSNVVARRLGTSVYYLVAAPEYLNARTLPAEPADLKSHDCVMFNAKKQRARLGPGQREKKGKGPCVGPKSRSRDINSASAFVHRGPWNRAVCLRRNCDRSHCQRQTHPGAAEVDFLVDSRFSRCTRVGKFLPLRLNVFLEALASLEQSRCGSGNEGPRESQRERWLANDDARGRRLRRNLRRIASGWDRAHRAGLTPDRLPGLL